MQIGWSATGIAIITARIIFFIFAPTSLLEPANSCFLPDHVYLYFDKYKVIHYTLQKIDEGDAVVPSYFIAAKNKWSSILVEINSLSAADLVITLAAE